MKIALTGASGFVGTALQRQFEQAVEIYRNDTPEEILEKLQGVDVVINLAGAPIIKRWSEPYKKVLISSRVETTKRLVEAVNKSEVKQFISASAIGIYPDNVACDERCAEISDDFLGTLASQWEAEALHCTKPTAIIRFGVVLGKGGGALATMLTPFKLGIGGIIGDGKMMTSWIDIDDLMRVYSFIIEKELTGVLNATAPHPVTNDTFTRALGKVLHRPTIFPVPTFVLKLMYGEGATVLTGSKEVIPQRLLDEGFVFQYPEIDNSLEHLLGE